MPGQLPYNIRQDIDGLTGKRLVYCALCDLSVFRFSGTEREGIRLVVEHALAHVDGLVRRS